MKDVYILDEMEYYSLYKLITNRIIGHHKTTTKDHFKGFPRSERGRLKEIFKFFNKKGYFIITSKKGKDPYFSLDPKKYPEVENLIKNCTCPLCGKYLPNTNYCKNCETKFK